MFGGKPTVVDHTNVPTAVFSEPEVGVVGLTEAQACERLRQGRHLQDLVPPAEDDARRPRHARASSSSWSTATTDRVVGCHIVGPDAGEMIQLVGIAVKMKATKADFDATMAVHPTVAEELVTLREKALTLSPRGGGVGRWGPAAERKLCEQRVTSAAILEGLPSRSQWLLATAGRSCISSRSVGKSRP